jgi:hypothetical protein
MNVNSDEVIYTMMITSLEDKIKSINNVLDIQRNLINKIMIQHQNNTEELIKYKEKYGNL